LVPQGGPHRLSKALVRKSLSLWERGWVRVEVHHLSGV
jgi:hypothetical protein